MFHECKKLTEKLTFWANKLKNTGLGKKLLALVFAINFAVSPVILASCNKNEEIPPVNADYSIVELIGEDMDDIAKRSEKIMRIYTVDNATINIQDSSKPEGSYLQVNTTGKVGNNAEQKNITFTLPADASNFEAMKQANKLAEDYAAVISDSTKTENDKNTAMNNYLNGIYNLVHGNKTNTAFAVTAIEDATEKESLSTLITAKDAVIAQVMKSAMTDTNKLDLATIDKVSELAKLSADTHEHTGAIISNTTSRKTGITTVVYRVTSSFGTNSFSIDYTLTTKGTLTNEQIRNIVVKTINGEQYIEDVNVSTGNFNWANAYHVALWQTINENTKVVTSEPEIIPEA